MNPYFKVLEAKGSHLSKASLLSEEHLLNITDFGAGPSHSPIENTKAINEAIEAAATKGGTVVVPQGRYSVYTMRLQSHVNLFLEEGAILQAAKTEIRHSYETQEGEGGNYDEPEVSLYVGLQDHGHSYFANSMFYGADLENVMIYGKGLLDGTRLKENGERDNVLLGGDPLEPLRRDQAGHQGEWFGNKMIALVRCKNVVLADFSILGGGHFAILATCIDQLLIQDLLVDTTRDALDVDCCQNVTVVRSTFNSLTDDAIVLKASFGGGIFMPIKNVLVEDCMVCGYDMGSVLDGSFSTDKLVATDRCGPTARVKLGTESTCGYEQVTVRRIQFRRSRGFALEAVDGSDLKHILFEDSVMEDVSSSPIFIKAGDRGRFPVTGKSKHCDFPWKEGEPCVRLDQQGWVLPDLEEYATYPVRRYTPSYRRNQKVTVDGLSFFDIVNEQEPFRLNPENCTEEMSMEEKRLRGNGVGSDHIARVSHIHIRNIQVKNADPRYPIELMGLMDSPLENVLLENLQVEYRGGLGMKEAVEQRQVNSNWEYRYNGKSERTVQSLPWLVNTFFLKHEGLLPRVQWDPTENKWEDAPFLVPELPEVYPEPSNWGILPAYGLYARHVKGLYLENIVIGYQVEDGRHPVVLDDIEGGRLSRLQLDAAKGVEEVVLVKNHCKRPTHLEYLPDQPYQLTEVKDVVIEDSLSLKRVELFAPAPGTPRDNLYSYPTVATAETEYRFALDTEDYPLPETVYRPFFHPIRDQEVVFGEELVFEIVARQPAYEVSSMETSGMIYNEAAAGKEVSLEGSKEAMSLQVKGLPEGASCKVEDFVPGQGLIFRWKPTKEQVRELPYEVTFLAVDKIAPVRKTLKIKVM